MLSGDFVFDISLLQTILFALFAIMTLFQGRLSTTNDDGKLSVCSYGFKTLENSLFVNIMISTSMV
ncbi:hypothetical protein B2G51_12280 [Leptospira santarosai]|nr:hypothetical protein B2G51_12280 [Leptospira santarosai]